MSAGHNDLDSYCDCRQCLMTSEVVSYMLFWMPRTDRAVHHVPAPRLKIPPGGLRMHEDPRAFASREGPRRS